MCVVRMYGKFRVAHEYWWEPGAFSCIQILRLKQGCLSLSSLTITRSPPQPFGSFSDGLGLCKYLLCPIQVSSNRPLGESTSRKKRWNCEVMYVVLPSGSFKLKRRQVAETSLRCNIPTSSSHRLHYPPDATKVYDNTAGIHIYQWETNIRKFTSRWPYYNSESTKVLILPKRKHHAAFDKTSNS